MWRRELRYQCHATAFVATAVAAATTPRRHVAMNVSTQLYVNGVAQTQCAAAPLYSHDSHSTTRWSAVRCGAGGEALPHSRQAARLLHTHTLASAADSSISAAVDTCLAPQLSVVNAHTE